MFEHVAGLPVACLSREYRSPVLPLTDGLLLHRTASLLQDGCAVRCADWRAVCDWECGESDGTHPNHKCVPALPCPARPP